jgi:hypothetical protein
VESLGGSMALEPATPRGVRLRAQVRAQPDAPAAAPAMVPSSGAAA